MAVSGLPRTSIFLTSKVGSGNPMGYLDTKQQVRPVPLSASPPYSPSPLLLIPRPLLPPPLPHTPVVTSPLTFPLFPPHNSQIQDVLADMNVTYVDLMLVCFNLFSWRVGQLV
jgi:hypothetical protein